MLESAAFKLLPACGRCRRRKIKCDKGAPKCRNCVNANVDCILVDPVTLKHYSRDYVYRLEKKEKALEALANGGTATTTRPRLSSSTAADYPAENSPSGSGETTNSRSNVFVGDGSGSSFLHSIFLDKRWQLYKAQILQHLAERTQIPELVVAPNPRPSVKEGSRLLDNYFARFHIHHTFLLRQDVLNIFRRIYFPVAQSPPSAQDYFRLFMVFSISAVTLYRRGLSQEHPYGYYLAAQACLGDTPLVGSTDAIENLLLVSRFGMYHHIGTSLWEISQFCMRQCIELGLHVPTHRGTDLLKEQHRRRIFWECYILDRYSSGILGRPFAIAESDIQADLPIDASDETILEHNHAVSLSYIAVPDTQSPSELSVFIFCIHLRRITSGILSAFYTGRGNGTSSGTSTPVNPMLAGHIYVKLHGFLAQLEAWRRTAPVFTEPKTLYERPEWYDFMLEKDKLLTIRGAIHRAPRRNGQPPADLLAICLACANRAIELYNDMMQAKIITWTRSYFHVIFTAGLSIIYCVSLGVHSVDKRTATRNLHMCGQILQRFKQEMPDAGRFAVVFEILKDNLSRDHQSASNVHNCEEPVASALDIHWESSIGSHIHQTAPNLFYTGNQTSERMIDRPIALREATVSSPTLARGGLLSPLGTDGGHSMRHDELSEVPLTDAHDELLGWPTLTDEMMENLEAGLGEFAWGAMSGIELDINSCGQSCRWET